MSIACSSSSDGERRPRLIVITSMRPSSLPGRRFSTAAEITARVSCAARPGVTTMPPANLYGTTAAPGTACNSTCMVPVPWPIWVRPGIESPVE